MSEICKNWSMWLKKTRFSYMDENQVVQTLNWLIAIRDIVLNMADLKEGQKIADFGCGSGLLAFGVLERFQDKVELIFSDKFHDCIEECQKILNSLNIAHNATFLQSDMSDIKLPKEYLDRALTRSVLVHIKDKQPVFNELFRVLKPQGIYCAFEPIISQNTRYYELLNEDCISDYNEFKIAEKEFMENPDDPLVNFNEMTLKQNIDEAGFGFGDINIQVVSSKYIAQKEAIKTWFLAPPAPDQKTMKERFLQYFDEIKVNKFIEEVQFALDGKEVQIDTKTALIKAIK